MPVAMRKRSWEEHVTQRSGLPYSFDDLDLVCCRSAGPGPGHASKHGRQVRCASMPECRHHRRPAPDCGSAVGDAGLPGETRGDAAGKADAGRSVDGPDKSGVLEAGRLLSSPGEEASGPEASKDTLSSCAVIKGAVESFGDGTEHDDDGDGETGREGTEGL